MNHPIHRQYIDEAIRAQVFPGGQLYIRRGKRIYHNGAVGTLRYGGASVTEQTRYDIASVTKVFTWTLVLQAVERGILHWDTHVQEMLPDFQCSVTTLWHLCTHTSGITDNLHAYYFQGQESMRSALWSVKTNPGITFWYSCANSILAGWMLEAVTGMKLDTLVQEHICAPLGMTQTSFVGGNMVAPTECCPIRGEICGVVHDEKAATLGFPVGNAGIFSSLADMSIFWEEWISGTGLLRTETKQFAWTDQLVGTSVPQGIGWLRDRISVRGQRIFPGMVAHAGFTGCQLVYWPQEELVLIALTNRIHPSREASRFTECIEGLLECVLLVS